MSQARKEDDSREQKQNDGDTLLFPPMYVPP